MSRFSDVGTSLFLHHVFMCPYNYEYDMYISQHSNYYSPQRYRSTFSLGFILTPINLGFGFETVFDEIAGGDVREDEVNLRSEGGGMSSETLRLEVCCTLVRCRFAEDACGLGGSEG